MDRQIARIYIRMSWEILWSTNIEKNMLFRICDDGYIMPLSLNYKVCQLLSKCLTRFIK